MSLPASCSTCHNTQWDITYKLLNDSSNIYELTVKATYVGPTFDFTYIDSVSFLFDAFGSSDYQGTPTVAGPTEATWSVNAGGLNANGCNGSGANFWCAQGAMPSQLGATHNNTGTDTDTWVFTIDVKDSLANLPTTTTTGHLKVRFLDANGRKVGALISSNVTMYDPPTEVPVPEPASLVLLGSGLLAGAARMRRKRQ